MRSRGIINASSIKENFPHYYKRLFSDCQIVVSAADSFFWTGGYGRFFGGVTVQQKLPTKNYVGLEIIPERKIVFAENLYGYYPTEDRFVSTHFDPAKEKRLLKYLEAYWSQLDPQRKIKGFKIHILSESHCGGGLGTTGVVLACLATALFVLAKKIEHQDIEKWEIVPTNELIFNKDYIKFMQLYRLSWRLTAICRDGVSSGATSFAALLKTPYPIIYMSEGIYNFVEHPSIKSPENILDSCSVIEQISFWGGKLEEIFNLRLPLAWPIDIGRVYSGTLVNTENILKSVSEIKNEHYIVHKFVNKKLAENLGFLRSKTPPFFYVKSQNQDLFWKEYIGILNTAALRTLSGLGELFEHGFYEANLRDFFRDITQEQDLSHYLGTSTRTLDKICTKLGEEIAKSNEFQLGGAKIEGIGKGGHVLFVAPAGTLSYDILQTVEEFEKNLKKEIYLDWASWIDGFGEDGLRVEQDLFNQVYSEYITPSCCRLLSFQETTAPYVEIVSQSEIPNKYKKYDLFLNHTENKIIIKGKILSSRDISSASATIDIFKILLKNPGKQVSNRQLGNLSYANSRYDLQSKIFIPLSKVLKKKTGKLLDYKISGGIYDNFWAMLDPKNLKIGILEKIEQ